VTASPDGLRVLDLGRLSYAQAYRLQVEHVEAVLAARAAGAPVLGHLLLVEHDPVITVSRRPGAGSHLLATPEILARLGVSVEETDRGGDITYHGPGQLVAYPILDLNYLNLGLHAYMRLLESVVIDACARWGVVGQRDPLATGVWVERAGQAAKIAAMGVRVRKWVSMHGLSLNINPNMHHFDLIVPCGLAGRAVTSLEAECRAAGRTVPSMADAKLAIIESMSHAVGQARDRAIESRAAVTDTPPRTDSGSTQSRWP
jgi:lipoate-protein ligase B